MLVGQGAQGRLPSMCSRHRLPKLELCLHQEIQQEDQPLEEMYNMSVDAASEVEKTGSMY